MTHKENCIILVNKNFENLSLLIKKKNYFGCFEKNFWGF